MYDRIEEDVVLMNNQSNLFTNAQVSSKRCIHTCSSFARTSLLYLQEAGTLQAIRPHVSSRENLQSYLFFLVLEGSGWLEYDGERYELTRGSAVFIDCKKGYRQSSSEKLWRLSWAHFNSSQMSSLWNKYCERGGKPVFKPENLEPYISLLDQLYTTASSDSYIRDIELNIILAELMGLLFRETVYEENGDVAVRERLAGLIKESERKIESDRIDVAAIKSYIDTYYKDPLTLEFLADHFHFHKSYLSRVFREVYGITVNGYIQLVRVGKAKEKLRFSSMNIEQISYECGYGGEANYFSRVFKKVEGCSPSDFRRNWTSNGGEKNVETE